MKTIYRFFFSVLFVLLLLMRRYAEEASLSILANAALFLYLLVQAVHWFLVERKPGTAPAMQGRASLVSRRVDPWRAKYGNGCFYVVTFRLGGSELELLATEGEYRALKEGTEGHLVWRADDLLSFTPESQ